ncbi:hypothetical protein ACOMCU_22365 [Lysinibacillus sp. UGB7]|uniref:hypothetical protein n=1 Tax=Lysinibacillus sp. UGB7 TaxID=3411039 RepID=UPI003B7B27F4
MIDLFKEQKFGYWTVLEESKNAIFTKGEITYYKCKCTCGKESDVREESLVNGLSTSCGCMRRKERKELHVGAKFGSWRITDSTFDIEAVEKIYKCQCSNCKKEVTGYRTDLGGRMKKACKCNVSKEAFQIGSQYGNWTIIDSSDKVSSSVSEKYYLCQCDCGTVRDVVDRSLSRLLSTSCGCSRAESQKKIHSILGGPDLRHFSGDIFGKWKVLRRDILSQNDVLYGVYECLKCRLRLQVRVGLINKKCPLCNHPKNIDKDKLMIAICESHNLHTQEQLYFEKLIRNHSQTENLKYVLFDGKTRFSGTIKFNIKSDGHKDDSTLFLIKKGSND